jgi:hypothetical protein
VECSAVCPRAKQERLVNAMLDLRDGSLQLARLITQPFVIRCRANINGALESAVEDERRVKRVLTT